MKRFSTNNGDRYEIVCSELSLGGYVNADENVELPNYLVHLPSQNDFIMYIYLEDKINESGNSGDLDDDGDSTIDVDDIIKEVELERSHVLLGYDGIEQVEGGEMNSVLNNIGRTVYLDEVKVTEAQDDWFKPTPKTAMGGTNFDKVDNPGG